MIKDHQGHPGGYTVPGSSGSCGWQWQVLQASRLGRYNTHWQRPGNQAVEYLVDVIVVSSSPISSPKKSVNHCCKVTVFHDQRLKRTQDPLGSDHFGALPMLLFLLCLARGKILIDPCGYGSSRPLNPLDFIFKLAGYLWILIPIQLLKKKHTYIYIYMYIWLAVSSPLKNMSSSVGMMTFPYMMESHKKVMFQTTNHIYGTPPKPTESHFLLVFAVHSVYFRHLFFIVKIEGI